ncbi:hypothetical protein Pcinc_016326 [Petrolisthes cinctipes]|uniref:Uncharacterized protein n=1 Tax=Petrolisthes cinctipes TaxID=88211 RepID=A0AAE1FRB2_PETCI|nr:hypothetical protein Pcinc_016326 [Petrolisthes cinctipes]
MGEVSEGGRKTPVDVTSAPQATPTDLPHSTSPSAPHSTTHFVYLVYSHSASLWLDSTTLSSDSVASLVAHLHFLVFSHASPVHSPFVRMCVSSSTRNQDCTLSPSASQLHTHRLQSHPVIRHMPSNFFPSLISSCRTQANLVQLPLRIV